MDKRLAQDDGSTLRRLFTSLSGMLAQRLTALLPWLGAGAGADLAPWAPMVVALDETTLDQVARGLPPLRDGPAGDVRLLPGKLAALFDGRTQQVVRVDYRATVHQHEKLAARALVADVPKGRLLLADLGHWAVAWFDDLTTAGQWWVSRLRAKTRPEVLHVAYQSAPVWEGLVWLGKYRADRAAHPVRLGLAARAGSDPFESSLPLFLRHLPLLAAAGHTDPLGVLVERGEAAGILRPSRRTRIVAPASSRPRSMLAPLSLPHRAISLTSPDENRSQHYTAAADPGRILCAPT